MNIKPLAFTFILVSTLTFTTAIAYHASTNPPSQGKDNSLPQTSPNPNESLSLKPTSSPTVPSQLQSTHVSLGPMDGFKIISPCNTIYGSSTITVEILGRMLVGRNVQLSVTYSLDGQERLSFPLVIKQANDWDPFNGIITGSVTLKQLSEGPHRITVYANFKINSNSKQAQGTVYFTIEGCQITNEG